MKFANRTIIKTFILLFITLSFSLSISEIAHAKKHPEKLDQARPGKATQSNPLFTDVLHGQGVTNADWVKIDEGLYIGPTGRIFKYDSANGSFALQGGSTTTGGKTYDQNGILIRSVQNTYGDNGNIIGWTETSSYKYDPITGELIGYTRNTYGANDTLTNVSEYSGIVTDSAGRTKQYTKTDTLPDGQTKTYAYNYNYDENGKLTTSSYAQTNKDATGKTTALYDITSTYDIPTGRSLGYTQINKNADNVQTGKSTVSYDMNSYGSNGYAKNYSVTNYAADGNTVTSRYDVADRIVVDGKTKSYTQTSKDLVTGNTSSTATYSFQYDTQTGQRSSYSAETTSYDPKNPASAALSSSVTNYTCDPATGRASNYTQTQYSIGSDGVTKTLTGTTTCTYTGYDGSGNATNYSVTSKDKFNNITSNYDISERNIDSSGKVLTYTQVNKDANETPTTKIDRAYTYDSTTGKTDTYTTTSSAYDSSTGNYITTGSGTTKYTEYDPTTGKLLSYTQTNSDGNNTLTTKTEGTYTYDPNTGKINKLVQKNSSYDPSTENYASTGSTTTTYALYDSATGQAANYSVKTYAAGDTTVVSNYDVARTVDPVTGKTISYTQTNKNANDIPTTKTDATYVYNTNTGKTDILTQTTSSYDPTSQQYTTTGRTTTTYTGFDTASGQASAYSVKTYAADTTTLVSGYDISNRKIDSTGKILSYTQINRDATDAQTTQVDRTYSYNLSTGKTTTYTATISSYDANLQKFTETGHSTTTYNAYNSINGNATNYSVETYSAGGTTLTSRYDVSVGKFYDSGQVKEYTQNNFDPKTSTSTPISINTYSDLTYGQYGTASYTVTTKAVAANTTTSRILSNIIRNPDGSVVSYDFISIDKDGNQTTGHWPS